ncbi:MAG: hypothetical protein ACYDHF_01365 [Candidatus Cryosericum sp.]
MKTTMDQPFSPQVRIGRSLRELRDLFQHRVNVEGIMEPLVSVTPDTDALELKEDLMARDWDAVGVADEGRTALRFVDRDDLRSGTAADCSHPITPDMLIPNSSSVLNLFKVLGTRDYAFVLTSDGVTGIVTRADLEKPPVHLLLFGYLQLFEARLQSLISDATDSEVSTRLPPTIVDQARHMWIKRHEHNHALSVADCLSLWGKTDLVLADERRWRQLGDDHSELERSMHDIVELRNRLSHGEDIAPTREDWQWATAAIRDIEEMLRKADSNHRTRIHS